MELDTENHSNIKEYVDAVKQALIHKCQLIRIDQVSEITTLAKSTINLWTSQNRFVKPIALSQTIKVWELQAILDWIEQQKEGRKKNSGGESK